MIGVEFNIGPARNALRRAIDLLTNMVPVYEDISEYLLQVHRKRFISGTDPDGNPWAAKSEHTLARYKRLGYGTLSRPLIGPSKRLSREIQRFVSQDGVIIGSSLIYSRVMQEGAEAGEFGITSRGLLPFGRIPARRWLGMSTAEEENVVAIVDDHIGQALDQAE